MCRSLYRYRQYNVSYLHFGYVLALVICLISGTAHADNDKYAALVVDSDTNRVLFSRNADKLLHPASLTKMMTLLLTFEAIENGELYPNQRIRVSRHAASMVPSKLGLSAGSSIKVKDAIPSLVTKSANDIAVALAETIGGSESRFATMMTRKAHQIGMKRTRFRNATGLHHPQQISTARDMARLGQYLIRQYPGYYNHFDRMRFRYKGETYHNHNQLLGDYRGMDGIKTGYISDAGFNLVASAERGNERLIGVVFGGRSARSRNAHMRHILNQGFKKLERTHLAARNVPTPESKPAQQRRIASAGDVALPPDDKPRGGSIAENPGNNETSLRNMISSGRFGELFHRRDHNAGRVERIRTGLMAVAAHTRSGGRDLDLESFFHSRDSGASHQKHASATQPASSKNRKTQGGEWSIQLGAYESRAQTEQVLRKASKLLKRRYQSPAKPLIAPRRAENRDGWIYRARFTDLNRQKARKACQLFSSCMAIAPAR